MTQPIEPTFEYTDMTPAQVEQKLRYLHDELDRGTAALRKARQEEMEAQTALTTGKAKAMLADDCPRVGVIEEDGHRITVAYRDAWVQLQIAETEQAYETAKVIRQAATDYLRTVRDQLGAVQSINASVREAYRGLGGGVR